MKYSEEMTIGIDRLFRDFYCEVEYEMYSNSPQDRAEGLGATSLDEGSVTITNINELWNEFVADSIDDQVEVIGKGIDAVVKLDATVTSRRRWPQEDMHFEDFEGYLIESLINSLSDNKW